jgi:hypothetical protein
VCHFLISEIPTIQLKVGDDAGPGDGFGDDASTALEAPEESA